ncbi:MAG: tetratricopeptide repeat protein [Deltaproteobacteria bacterium]|nr:tetratricopeptide repeat protein [Deltaproteobacteria bacterium]
MSRGSLETLGRSRWTWLAAGFVLCAGLLASAPPAAAQSSIGRKLRTAEVTQDEEGWTIDVNFEIPVRYLRHSPQSSGRTLRIQVEPVNLGGSAEQPLPQENLPLSPSTRGPVRQIRYDASLPRQQFVEIVFDQPVRFEVEQGGDFRSLRIRVQSKNPMPSTPSADSKQQAETRASESDELSNLDPEDPAMKLLSEARRSLRDGDADRATALLNRILELPPESVDVRIRMNARELLGLTFERRAQLANARAEYEAYLREFPDGGGATRVAQRLDALLTAASEPRKKLKPVTVRRQGRGVDADVYGMLASRYYRSDAIVAEQDGYPLRSDIFSDANVAGRLETEDWRVRGDFFGSYDYDLSEGRSNDVLIRALSVEVEDRKRGIDMTLGRQRRSDSGVLGRFDGLRVTSRLGSRFEIAALAGLPVQSLRDTLPNTDKIFAGGSVTGRDLGIEGFEGQLFLIGQEAYGKTDRVGLGGEFRYSRSNSFSVLYLDYDPYFNSLNTALVTSTIPVSQDLSVLVQAERRNTPILTTSNALIGQLEDDLSELGNTYSDSEIKQLAEDRTFVLYSGMTGFTHQTTQDLQIAGDVTVYYLEGTPASGNVPESDSSGPDFSTSLQATVNDWLLEGGAVTVGARYFESDAARALGLTTAGRVPLFGNLRVHPRALLEYRDSSFEGERIRMAPSLEFIWQPSSFWIDLEVGLDWTKPLAGGISSELLGHWVDLTLRWDF